MKKGIVFGTAFLLICFPLLASASAAGDFFNRFFPETLEATLSTQLVAQSSLISEIPERLELLVKSASTRIGQPLREGGQNVGYPVRFLFTVESRNETVYLSKNPRTTFITQQAGVSSVRPLITSVTANPSTVKGDGAGHYIVPAGSTRTFTANATIRSDGVVSAGTKIFQIDRIYYGPSPSSLREYSTTQNVANLKAIVQLTPRRVSGLPSRVDSSAVPTNFFGAPETLPSQTPSTPAINSYTSQSGPTTPATVPFIMPPPALPEGWFEAVPQGPQFPVLPAWAQFTNPAMPPPAVPTNPAPQPPAPVPPPPAPVPPPPEDPATPQAPEPDPVATPLPVESVPPPPISSPVPTPSTPSSSILRGK